MYLLLEILLGGLAVFTSIYVTRLFVLTAKRIFPAKKEKTKYLFDYSELE